LHHTVAASTQVNNDHRTLRQSILDYLLSTHTLPHTVIQFRNPFATKSSQNKQHSVQRGDNDYHHDGLLKNRTRATIRTLICITAGRKNTNTHANNARPEFYRKRLHRQWFHVQLDGMECQSYLMTAAQAQIYITIDAHIF
jgi:hypothetical protein